jgi:uncharacterized protein (DUF1015 family)
MARIFPFAGWRFNPERAGLGSALCPPYDVIGPELAARLRRRAGNAIHLELPEGNGEAKYRRAALLWRRWRQDGLIARDPAPCLYVCEERFKRGGLARRRTGFLAALGVTPKAAAAVVAHERTLPKPKADRLSLLAAVRANISPIFGVFPDRGGAVRRALASVCRRKPTAAGRMASGVSYRLWAVSDPSFIRRLDKAFVDKKVLIADGHHRFQVSKSFYALSPGAASSTTLAYLCPEEDKGLVVLPTHRVLAAGARLSARAARAGRMTACRSLGELLGRLEKSRNPYAFGLGENGSFALCEPKNPLGCRSKLCVEWIGRRLLSKIPPERIRYTPDAKKALAMAWESGGSVVFVKPFPVSRIREAVAAVGLLPPKSTYFMPKIATGLAFKEL